MAYEFEPPIEIIQHIQSFLSGKEATQTCILSKSWFTAWLTRPDLCFDQRDFRHDIDLFNFSRKTVQRYKNLNLRIDRFILRLFTINSSEEDHIILADELIADALKMGVNELELELHSIWYHLPASVFASRSLTRLYVCNGIIDGDARFFSSPLKSLTLRNVNLRNDIIFQNILLGCPLIENLDLQHCWGLLKVNATKLLNLVQLVIKDTHVEFKDKPEFRYLRRLHLEFVKIDNDFFKEFSSRFPCIQDFTLAGLKGRSHIFISSHSLRYISLSKLGDELRILRLNVPNISKLIYKELNSCVLRRLEFMLTTVSKEWESDVETEIYYSDVFHRNDSWLEDFRNFLGKLSESKISLTIKLIGENRFPSTVVPCLAIPVAVENLTLCMDPRAIGKQTVLLGLLKSFRPNLVTGCKPDVWRSHDNCLLKLLDNKPLVCPIEIVSYTKLLHCFIEIVSVLLCVGRMGWNVVIGFLKFCTKR